PVGTTYPVVLNSCTSEPRIAEKNISLSTPAGSFDNVVRLEFSNHCYHKSLHYAYFHPGVGLLQWKEFLFTGSYAYSLIEANINGNTYPSIPQLSSSALLTRGIVNVRHHDHVDAQITLSNISNEPANFTFFSGQDFEIEIIDLFGTVVNRWSVNKFFTQAIRDIVIEPGDTLALGDHINLVDFYGRPLLFGGYTLRIFVNGQAENSPEKISAESFIFLTYY
ncbi:MAG: BsuPI-related putative proteinase inhibitor, partial [Kangiellaceae bacterium]|nr:BsuPI-related putative proteinase inhibitor [Kangiellaceae bacterium]